MKIKIYKQIMSAPQEMNREQCEEYGINISIWATAHLPLPNINFNLLPIDCCWVRGGVGEQLPRYWYWSRICIPMLAVKGNQFVLLDLQSQERRMKTGIERGMDKWDGKWTQRWRRTLLIVSCLNYCFANNSKQFITIGI